MNSHSGVGGGALGGGRGAEGVGGGGDRDGVRCLVDAPLATASGEREVLDGIGDVRRLAVDADFFECSIEDLAGRADERLALSVLDVAGLLADEHDPSVR